MAPGTSSGAAATRIGIVLHDFAAGGTEHIIIRLANHWADAAREVTILCAHDAGPARALVGGGVAVRPLNPPVPRGFESRRRFAQRLGQTRFASRLPDLAATFPESDLLLSTSDYESFPATLVEAIVAGLPVVSTPSSVALAEILSHPSFGSVAPAEPAALAGALAHVWRGEAIDDPARMLDAVVAERA